MSNRGCLELLRTTPYEYFIKNNIKSKRENNESNTVDMHVMFTSRAITRVILPER